MDEFWDETGLEKQLAGLQSRRADLCEKMARTLGKAKQMVAAELSVVNKDIRRINLRVSERREARALWLAAREVMADDQFDDFMRAAKAHRMGTNPLSEGAQ